MTNPPQIRRLVFPDISTLAPAPSATPARPIPPFGQRAHIDHDRVAVALRRGRHPLQVADRGRIRDVVGRRLALLEPLDGGVRGRRAGPAAVHARAAAVGQRVRGLLVVQARRQQQGVQPRRAARDGSALRDGAEVGERDDAARGEAEARDGRVGPIGERRRCPFQEFLMAPVRSYCLHRI